MVTLRSGSAIQIFHAYTRTLHKSGFVNAMYDYSTVYLDIVPWLPSHRCNFSGFQKRATHYYAGADVVHDIKIRTMQMVIS